MDRFVFCEHDLMNKSSFLTIFFSLCYLTSWSAASQPDSILNAQILYNGRIWRNLNYMVIGDPYFLSNAFLNGSLTISGKTFSPLRLKYNLFEDEVHIPVPSAEVLQLNKEMVDSFTLLFNNKIYRFSVIPEDSLVGLRGYVQVLYHGKIDLYVKYTKKIKRSDFESRPDKYYQITRVFCVQNKRAYSISGKVDLLNFSKENKAQVKDFMRKNKLHVSKKYPESFIPVISYMNTLN